MTKYQGLAQNPTTDVSLIGRAPASAHKTKRPLRVFGAGIISVAMVGVLALPAYAAHDYSTVSSEAGYAQVLTTNESVEAAIPLHVPTAAMQPVTMEEVGEVPLLASSGWVKDVAPSPKAEKMVAAALSELGAMQDCTDLVQNSLAAIGLAERRDKGGYDHGTWSLQTFGSPVTDGKWAPGDILGWPGYPHVAVYIGNGQAVHGGMGGSTVIAPATGHFGTPAYVVRPA